jgi:putative transposase
VLLAAGKHLVTAGRPLLYADSGVENVNSAVDSILITACLDRILAQVEVAFSNSLIEAYWRSLKHQWVFLNTLDSVARVRALVEFYVNEHNTKMRIRRWLGRRLTRCSSEPAPECPRNWSWRSAMRGLVA